MIEQAIRDHMEQLYDTLTERETRIVELVLEGMSTREIAETVHLSEQSVKLYPGRLFRKFGVSNRSQLIAIAFQRIGPVSDLIGVFRMAMDRRRVEGGRAPLIPDPLEPGAE